MAGKHLNTYVSRPFSIPSFLLISQMNLLVSSTTISCTRPCLWLWSNWASSCCSSTFSSTFWSESSFSRCYSTDGLHSRRSNYKWRAREIGEEERWRCTRHALRQRRYTSSSSSSSTMTSMNPRGKTSRNWPTLRAEHWKEQNSLRNGNEKWDLTY